MSIGIDIAQMDLNGQRVANWMQLAKAGVSFAILRKSQCYRARDGRFVLATDPTYADNVAAARAAGVIVGGYCFPDFAKGRPDMVAQAANYKAAGPARIPGKDLPDFIDVEFPGNGIVDTGRLDPNIAPPARLAQLQADVAADVLELASQMTIQTGRRPGVYTSHVQMHDTNGLGGHGSPELGDCDLWQKVPYHLTAQKPLDTSAPLEPHIGPASWDPFDYYRTPAVWEKRGTWIEQVQGDVRGILGVFQCDVNRWRYLSRGLAKHDDPRVPIVQQRLAQLGYEITVNGSWNDATDSALEDLQLRNGLRSDAVIGPATFVTLFP